MFEQQKDDATNIHGLYARMMRILAPNPFEVRLIHPQQAGVDFVKAGTRLELTQGASMQTLGYATVKTVQWLNKESTIVETEEPLLADVKPGDCVADAEANTAEVLIRNCTFGKLSANPYDPDSTANQFGRYGSPFSPDSMNNQFGAGSPFRPDSPNNPYGKGWRIDGR